jgi:nucleoside-diphosphate-sugar epimerase
MGSAIGTNIAACLEADPAVTALAGMDLEPPRRFLPTADFHFVQPGDAARVTEIVTNFKPTVVVHAWVFEPRARSSPGQARVRTMAGTESLLGALRHVDSVERIAVRSGVAIYGRGRASAEEPGVDEPPRPTTTFGTMLTRVEDRCREVADSLGATAVSVRLASVMASNLPNPLGRYLRLPVVPTPITTKRFGVVHLGDAARVVSAAATSPTPIDVPLNVMAADPVTPLQAVTIGRRPSLPIAPFVFRAGRLLGEVAGTPIPEHVTELLSRGQVVAPTDTDAALGVPLRRSTPDAISDLYAAGRLITIDVERLAAGAT